MLKILLGILIGLGITFTGVAMANSYAGTAEKTWNVAFAGGDNYKLSKVRDGSVICYLFYAEGNDNFGNMNCLVEPR